MTDRYARQICLPEIGPRGQARLAAARVLVVGAGGLGSGLLPLLAGAGCGTLRILDHDVVEESNLHRQVLYRMSDIGQPKASAAARALCALAPACQATAIHARLDPPLARQLIADVDIIVDAADSFAVTYALSDLCTEAGVPLISASVLGRAGYVGGFCGGAPSYRAVFPDLPPSLSNCAETGVMGPAVAALAALQAQMVLAVLLGHDPSPLGQMIQMDLAYWRFSGFRFDGAPEPGTCLPVILGRDEIGPGDLVVELRDTVEAPDLPVPHACRIPAEALDDLIPAEGQRVVFVCTSGLRAWRAAKGLAARRSGSVAILATGR
ncbi:MAG: ThiF family adenylyltransferase [Qingshengfaniella sp.]